MPNGNSEDWALVVGIARYPNYGPTETESNDLRGPVNDAKEVTKLLSQIFHVANITTITSDGLNGASWPTGPAARVQPERAEIEAWFRNLHLTSAQNIAAGRGPRIGHRLYIYLSGHGLAPEYWKRALVTAEAFSKGLVNHLLATVWGEHLRNTLFFDEYVLCMDCCTQARVTLIPTAPPFEIKDPIKPAPPMVMVCAAKFPYEAIELPIGADGSYHGVFTYELVRGLSGGAANPESGGIRTSDLKGFLINSMRKRINEIPDRTNISTEPEFLLDDDIVFATPQEAPPASKPRKIMVGSPDGTPIRVLNGKGTEIAAVVVVNGAISRPLPSGLYKLVSPTGSKLIEIAGDEEEIDGR